MQSNLTELEKEKLRQAASALVALRMRAANRDEYIRLSGLAEALKLIAGPSDML